jgi:uncharacterized protein (TIGR00255 family)
MVNSMTGYGQAEGEVNGVTYAVEIKTVNNRYFKTAVKLPETAAFLEEDIERLLRSNLSRGTVNYALRIQNASVDVLFNIDEAALRAVMEKLGRVASSADIKGAIDVGGLLNLPGILSPVSPDEETAQQVKEAVLRITQEALDKLKRMRAAEGAALAADLNSHCEAIKQALEQIRARNAVVLQEYTKRLKKRVDELLADVKLELDEETLAREVAVFAERSDVSEEFARLDSHLEQFAESCQGGGAAANDQVGRRLEFISQEMLREANTIASKACDSEITRCVMDMKCRIDRIKEQVQNIE